MKQKTHLFAQPRMYGRGFLAKEHAEIFIDVFRQCESELLLLSLHTEFEPIIARGKAKIQHIANGLTVDLLDQVARHQSHQVGGACGHDLAHPAVHLRHRLSHLAYEVNLSEM